MTPSMLDEAQSIIVSPFIVTCNYQSNLMPHKNIGNFFINIVKIKNKFIM